MRKWSCGNKVMLLAGVSIGVFLVRAVDASLGKECSAYLAGKNLKSPEELKEKLTTCASGGEEDQELYHPNPKPKVPGASDTTHLGCKYGNPSPAKDFSTCCGWRPHFNWILAECSSTDSHFCNEIPKEIKAEMVKINYVAAYQFDGTDFVLMDESSGGQLSEAGIAGNYASKTGWERVKNNFAWKSGDWAPKYAPWARGKGVDGPRGVTPPAGLFVLSAENFYYGAFYMLSQLTINLSGKDNPTGTDCWTWELDPVEGTIGWLPPGSKLPGNLNMLYSTGNAVTSGCMPVPFTALQTQGLRQNFSFPRDFVEYCRSHPDADGCDPWQNGQNIWWSGTVGGTQRFENTWGEPYVFAIVLDQKGYWIYRWRPDASGHTGWPGIERYKADRKLGPRPYPVKDVRGLATDIPGDVVEAVMLQPSLLPEATCLRSSIQPISDTYGADALGAMAHEMRKDGPGGGFDGAQNWWSNFADTKQLASNYPLSIAGIPLSKAWHDYECNAPNEFSNHCSSGRNGPSPGPFPVGPSSPRNSGSLVVIIIVVVILILAVASGSWLFVLRWRRQRTISLGGEQLSESLSRVLPSEAPLATSTGALPVAMDRHATIPQSTSQEQ